MKVDVVADYGIPERAVARIIASSEHRDVPYELNQVHRQIPLHRNGELDLEGIGRLASDDRADALIVVTETPRRDGGDPKISAIYIDNHLAIISMPALGLIGVRRRLERTIATSIDILREGRATSDIKSRVRPFQVEQSAEEGAVFLYAPWWIPGRMLLVLGMVAMNEPLKTLPKLTGALAAAAATSAFGIFYSTIWQMADALPTLRLGAIALTVILLMVSWLIVSNGLWNRGRRYGSRTEAAMYNAAVVVTLLMSVSLLYLTLFIGILITGLVVIEAGYLSSVIGEEASFANYLDISWLAASMGTAAGALGSNFDDEADIRRLTHGRREALRMNDED